MDESKKHNEEQENTRIAPAKNRSINDTLNEQLTLASDKSETRIQPPPVISEGSKIQNSRQDTTLESDATRIQDKLPHGKTFGRRSATTWLNDTDVDTEITFDPESANRCIAVGDRLNNRFILEKILGSGGMGEVFRAKDIRRVETADSRPYVALKLLRQELRSHTKFMIALQRESKKVQELSHPNIVTVYDFDRDGAVAYINMEYLEGESLDLVIFKRIFDKKAAMYAIDRMARGLAFAHQEGYVHADFKPANVFYTDSRSVKILDFGIAQAVKKIRGRYVNIVDDETSADIYALTPNYASLEMLNGEHALPVDDVYSLCCVAYELLTGSHPFTDEQGRKVNAQEAHARAMSPATIDHIPKHYAEALRKGLAFKRRDRFDNAGLLLDALKPKSRKKHAIATLAAIIFVALSYIGVDTWNAQKVPSLSSLIPPLHASANMITEGDTMLQEGDIDLAHRFYTQAWNEGNDLNIPKESITQLKRILDHRMNKVTRALISELQQHKDDAFRTQQILIALEFIKKSELGTLDEAITQIIEQSL